MEIYVKSTEMANKDGTWLREISFCCCLPRAGKTRQLLLNKMYIPFLLSLYIFLPPDAVNRLAFGGTQDWLRKKRFVWVIGQPRLASMCIRAHCSRVPDRQCNDEDMFWRP